MEQFLQFVREWGYVAVFLGSLIEGESIILTASCLAAMGYLDIYKVGLVAFSGTLIADQALYYAGWHYGRHLFDRYPKYQKQVQRAFDLLHKYKTGFIMSCRFIYGIRIISSVVVGAAKIPPRKFIPLNFIAAAVWAVVSCGAGYLLGEAVFHFMETCMAVQKYIVWGLAGVALIIWGVVWNRRRLRS